MSVHKGAGIRAQAEVYAHKLFAPTRHAGAIRREAILERVFAEGCARIVVLQGPAGHGKSTALQQLKSEFEARGHLCGWLSFDEADNDARRFSIHMHALVSDLLGGAAVASDEDENSELGRRRRADWMIDCLFRLGKPVAIFFDEFQTLRDKSILSFLRGLLERVPENVRIFIGSRSVPEIGLARLVINNQALILRADDLRFSPAEVEQFFAASHDLAVSAEEVKAIYSRTEGWPAALQLFRLTLVSPQVRKALVALDSYRPRELAEYLVENVLGLQPPQVQEFLLRTSLLNRLSAPLCDEVTGRKDSQEMLQQLERSGLFLRALDSDTHWFKYHALFSSFLAEQQRAASAEVTLEVHRRAARWHLEQGLYEEAVHHFICCRDFTAAADTMNVWATRLTAGAHLSTVERWYDQLPFEEVAKRPDLAIKVAYVLVFLRRHQKLRPLLQLLQQMRGGTLETTTNADIVLSMAAVCADNIGGAFDIIGRVRVEGLEPAGFAAFELGAGANLVGYRDLAMGDLERARHHLALARAYSNRGDASFSGGYTVGLTGVTLMMQGQLDAALDNFRKGMAEQRMHLDGSFASAALVSCYIWALYEANELDLVEALFAQYREVIAEACLLDFLAVAYLPMARTHDARGRPAKAMEVLDEAESIGHANGWERLVRLVQWERVRRWLVSGAVDRARALAAHIAPAGPFAQSWRQFCEDLEGESFGHIRLAIHAMDVDTASALLAHELGQQRDRVNRQIKLHLLDALLQDKKGVRNAAHRSLRKALQLAQPGEFVRSFIDEGESVLQLLREEYQAIMDGAGGPAAQFGADRAFVERILQASGTDLSRAPVTVVQPIEALTDREKEILMFLANGVSNKEMAGRIFVSENTVKFHLKNIYSKLAVTNRLQAISAARQLGIVH